MQYLLDTNVYRNLVIGREFNDFQTEIQKIKFSEEINGFKFLFSNAVCIELLNHLSSTDSANNECYKALFYKIRICSDFVNDKLKGNLVPEFNELLSLYFFKKSSSYFELNNDILKLAFEITKVNDSKNSLIFQEQIHQIIKYKKKELDNIIQNIENNYLSFFSETKDWSVFKVDRKLKNEFQTMINKKIFHKLLSFALIKMTFEKEKDFEYKFSNDNISQFNSDFVLSIDFFIQNIWKKFIDMEKIVYFSNPENDPKKRWNSFYDTQIIMACEYENIKGRKTILVTSENKILNQFKRYKREEWCMSYKDFKTTIIKY